MDIRVLQDRVDRLNTKKDSRISSQFQYEVNEVYELLNKKVSFPILARHYKRNTKAFIRAKDYIYGSIKDGQEFDNRGAYFMWLLKHYGKEQISK